MLNVGPLSIAMFLDLLFMCICTGYELSDQIHISPGAREAKFKRDQYKLSEEALVDNKRLISLAYGYSSTKIGTTVVQPSTSYADLYSIARPFVYEYLNTAVEGQEAKVELLNNFKLTDPNGKAVIGLDAEVSCVLFAVVL